MELPAAASPPDTRLRRRNAAAMNYRFTWRDAERTIRFGSDVLDSAVDELDASGWTRFELLATPRALRAAPVELPRRAAAVHEVPDGPVPEAAAAVLEGVTAPSLVALGGGRVIDAAKAVAAVRGGRVAAIPTTLSGAEMTRIHRLPERHDASHRVRPALVLADPHEMTSLPERDLRASAMNALAHGIEPLYVPGANPVATLAALRGAELIAGSLDRWPAGGARSDLALGSVLCAYALDSAGLALAHVICQTLVRTMRVPHAATYATLLPRTTAAMRHRAAEPIAALAEAIGTAPDRIAERIEALGGGPRHLADLGAKRERLDAAVDAMLRRPELGDIPDPPDREELLALVSSAW